MWIIEIIEFENGTSEFIIQNYTLFCRFDASTLLKYIFSSNEIDCISRNRCLDYEKQNKCSTKYSQNRIEENHVKQHK